MEPVIWGGGTEPSSAERKSDGGQPSGSSSFTMMTSKREPSRKRMGGTEGRDCLGLFIVDDGSEEES